MVDNERTTLVAAVLQERSRDALVDRLTEASAALELPELLGFFADVLLAAGSDRDHLKERLVSLLAARFGRSSERASAEQLSLFAEAIAKLSPPSPTVSQDEQATNEPKPSVSELIEATDDEIEALVEARRAAHRAEQERRRTERAAAKAAGTDEQTSWPRHLPVREVVIDVADDEIACPDCQRERPVLRVETSWQLERTVSTEVVVTHRRVRACGSHHRGPVTAPPPLKPVDKGHLGFELAAWAIYLRFAHNLPIRRIAEIFASENLPVSRSMLDTLFTITATRFGPVFEALGSRMRGALLVNLDDTPVLILDPGHKKRRREGRVWLALGDGKWAWYFATPDWTAKAAANRLGKLKGTLQGDGYKAFGRMARELGIELAGCMAHLRRKLRAALDAHDPRAAEAIALIQGLYRIEKLARLRKLDADGIVALRQERSVPLMDALDVWAQTVAPTVEVGSPLGKAWTYFTNQRTFLRTYLTDGRVSIDNNAAERGLRRITIGRKLWLFFRGDVTVERAAILASVLTTARLHGADELAYLTWLLREVARRTWSPAQAVALLPDAWLASQQEQAKKGGAVEG
jgi:transposase